MFPTERHSKFKIYLQHSWTWTVSKSWQFFNTVSWGIGYIPSSAVYFGMGASAYYFVTRGALANYGGSRLRVAFIDKNLDFLTKVIYDKSNHYLWLGVNVANHFLVEYANNLNRTLTEASNSPSNANKNIPVAKDVKVQNPPAAKDAKGQNPQQAKVAPVQNPPVANAAKENVTVLAPDALLSPQNLPTLYAPIITTFISQGLAAILDGVRFGLSARHAFLEWKAAKTNDDLNYFTERAQIAFSQRDFVAAAKHYRNARNLFVHKHTLSPNNKADQLKLIDFYYYEALSFFLNHKYQSAEIVLTDLLILSSEKIDALNLRGIIYLELGEEQKAEEDFARSLRLDATQTDMYSLHAYCQSAYKDVIKYSNFDYKHLWAIGVAHIILRCRGIALLQLIQGRKGDDEHRQYEKIATCFYYASQCVPKNEAYTQELVFIYYHLASALLKLSKDNKPLTLKKLLPEEISSQSSEKPEADAKNSQSNQKSNQVVFTKEQQAELIYKAYKNLIKFTPFVMLATYIATRLDNLHKKLKTKATQENIQDLIKDILLSTGNLLPFDLNDSKVEDNFVSSLSKAIHDKVNANQVINRDTLVNLLNEHLYKELNDVHTKIPQHRKLLY